MRCAARHRSRLDEISAAADAILAPDHQRSNRTRPGRQALVPVHSGGSAMKRSMMAAAAAGFSMMMSSVLSANAAEIKVLSSNALKTALEELAPAFEKATEHKLVIAFGAAVP